MKRSLFLLITALASFGFGALLFCLPDFGANLFGMDANPELLSVLRGMGGLIIGSACINFFLRNQENFLVMRGLLVSNIITHALGLLADILGVMDGALSIQSMAPVEMTHLFVGLGSFWYVRRLKAK